LIGLRWSSSPVIAEVVRQVSFPVTATSANLSGSPELETIGQIQKAFGSQVSLYLDGGRLIRPVSTVVKCVAGEVTILREGAIDSSAVYSLLSQEGLR
jgi:L-threonylcarbamoyladenylate synthase